MLTSSEARLHDLPISYRGPGCFDFGELGHTPFIGFSRIGWPGGLASGAPEAVKPEGPPLAGHPQGCISAVAKLAATAC